MESNDMSVPPDLAVGKPAPPWLVHNQAAFTSFFQGTGYKFRFFDLILESGGSPIDIVFNYKDLAHLEVVHNTFNVFYSLITEDCCAGVLLQKVFGFALPMTHVSLQLRNNHLLFHNSIFNVIMTSEVTIEELPDYRSRVHTRYGIGAPRWLLPLLFPLLRRMLTRNFHVLMEGDVPMRNRRGELRRWGLDLPKTSYGFNETSDIRVQRVFGPREAEIPAPAEVRLADISGAPLFLNRSDHFGLQIYRQGNTIEVYPRLCPHEGSCLDGRRQKAGSLTCGWHGRRFRPILSFEAGQEGEFSSPFHRFILGRETVRIEFIRATDPRADWTVPIQR